jgi:hypothetical protein
MNRDLAGAAIALLMMVAPAAAQQPCTQLDLAGAWALSGSNNGEWSECGLVIDSEGAYEGRCLGTRHPKRRGTPIEGTIELGPDCSFAGALAGEGFSQPMAGHIVGDVGAGILKFGPPRKKLGLAFFLIRLPESDA